MGPFVSIELMVAGALLILYWFRKKLSRQHLGTAIIIGGVCTGIIGSSINDIGMHLPAIWVWTLLANPLLFIWAIGSHQKWWNSSLSYLALAVLYLGYEIGGIYALGYLK